MDLPIITYDYDFSPFGQKIRYLLHLSGLHFQRVEQPPVLPRPDLQALGITYRRMPLVAIGKDFYCDSAAIVNVVQHRLKAVPSGPADKAFEAFSSQLFESVLRVIPADFMDQSFKKDRETIFPILSRPDFEAIRPSSLAGLRSVLGTIETEFLGHGGRYLGGDQPTLADVYVAPIARWVLLTLGIGDEAGFEKEELPRVHAWVARLPSVQPDVIASTEAAGRIVKSRYLEETADVPADDVLAKWAGSRVSVESTDSTPGSHPQLGRLIVAGRDQMVLELENRIRLHFPRNGYIVKLAE